MFIYIIYIYIYIHISSEIDKYIDIIFFIYLALFVFITKIMIT